MNPRRFTSLFKVVCLTFLLAAAYVGISSNLTHASTGTQTQTAAKPVGVGEAAPDFTLVDHHGTKLTLSDSKGKSPVVLVFYRGYW